VIYAELKLYKQRCAGCFRKRFSLWALP